MKVISYINNIPIENYTKQEIEEFFKQVLPKSMKKIGWEPVKAIKNKEK